jgi:hypothetical protein
MAYSDGYWLAFILEGPVTTDTASFDHFEGSLIGRSGVNDDSLSTSLATASLTLGLDR